MIWHRITDKSWFVVKHNQLTNPKEVVICCIKEYIPLDNSLPWSDGLVWCKGSGDNLMPWRCLRRSSAFGSDWSRRKVRLAFRLHTVSHVKDRPKYASLSASQWLSRSGIPKRPLRVRWMQTCLRTIGLRSLESNLERDRGSASQRALGRGSTANR